MRVKGGFALIDVVVAVLILGIIAAVAAPRFGGSVNARRAEAAARLIAADLEYIRRQAITRSQTVTAAFDDNARTLTCSEVPGLEVGAEKFHRQLDVWATNVQMESDFDSSHSLQFDMRGNPSVNGVALINGFVLFKSGATVWRLTIAPNTGGSLVSRGS